MILIFLLTHFALSWNKSLNSEKLKKSKIKIMIKVKIKICYFLERKI